MLIRNILEESARKFDEVKAVKWLKKKEIMERSYGELMENVVSTRKGLLAEGFEGKHIALIGTSSVEWMESYLPGAFDEAEELIGAARKRKGFR